MLQLDNRSDDIVPSAQVVSLIRDILLNIYAFDTIKAEGFKHGLVIKTVQVHPLIPVSGMLVAVPGRDAKRIALLPLERRITNACAARPLYDMVNRGCSFTDSWRVRSCA